MRSALRRSAGTRRSSPYPSTAGMRLRSPCGGWMPCGATVRRPWWSCSTAIAPTNMPRASWPISWRRGDSCPWLRPLSSASTPTPRRVGRSLRGGPTGDDCAEAEAFGRVVAAKLAAGGVRAIDAKRLPTVRNGMLSMWRFVRFVLGYRRSQKRHPQRVAVETSADRCTHCGRCVKLCPTGAIVAGDELRTDAAKCIRCCACVKGCPVGARSYDSPFAPVLSRNFAQRKRNLTLM